MPTLNQASSRANAKYNANKPGSPIGGQPKIDFDTALDTMETAIGEFIARVLVNIENAKGKTGEPLINTGDITNISAEKTDKGWEIKAPPQLDWQSKGISGTKRKVPGSPYAFSGSKKSVNIDAIKTWIQQRGIVFEGVSEDSTAFLIGRSIYEQGIDPKRLWEGEVAKLAEDAGQAVADAIAAGFANRTTQTDVTIE